MESYGLKEPIKQFERGVIKDNIKGLLFWIFIVVVLLCVCITVDYADDNITVANENVSTCDVKVNDTSKVVGLDDNDSVITPKSSDKICTIKEKTKKVKKLPTISMWAKPSVRCGYPYKWYYRTFVDYCPNCHHYNCLLKNPKRVPENEYTCAICDSDFDGVVGKEKYSWSRVYLRRV